jgi:predicted DNA-binding transcriptional regulator AlpA
MENKTTKRIFLKEKEIAEMLGVDQSALRNWVKQGFFPKPVKIGNKWIAWHVEDVEAYIKKLREQA